MLARHASRIEWLLTMAPYILPFLLMVPMVQAWAGDAVIHLRIAELFSQGHYFEFNRGEKVIATTSFFWTVILAGFFAALGPALTAWAVKILLVGLWIANVIVLQKTWHHLCGSSLWGSLVALAFALNPGVFQNSLNGMEAIALALLLQLLFFWAIVKPLKNETAWLSALAILASLTRPEGIAFTLLLGCSCVFLDRRLSARSIAVLTGMVLGAMVYVSINYSVSGSLNSDSAFARLAAALRESILLGPIHIHPRSFVRAMAYLPLTLGILIAAWNIRQQNAAVRFALLIMTVFLFFYTFVVGAGHTIRYWIPFIGFYFGSAAIGLRLILDRVQRPLVFRLSVLGIVVWVLGVYGAEYFLRLNAGLGYQHETIVNAVANRAQTTETLRRSLGVQADTPLHLAVTEVQILYFLKDDDLIYIYSLDGRVSSHFKKYVDERTGLRDFDLLLTDIHPDFIEPDGALPEEPILSELVRRMQQNLADTAFEIQGHRFERTHSYLVRYMGKSL